MDGVFVAAEFGGKGGVDGKVEAGVLVKDELGVGAGIGKDETVFGEGGNGEGYGKAALLGSFEVSGAAHFHVFFGKLEAVFRGAEKVQALFRFLGNLLAPHENAVGAFGTAANAATELVELAEAEAFGTFDDHHRGVWNVDTYFDDGGGNEDVGTSGGESVHVECLFLGCLAAVDYSHLVLRQRECLHDFFISQFKVLVVQFFVLEDERIDYERLTALGDFVTDEVMHGVALVFAHADGLDGLSSGGHLVDDGDVEVSVEGHCQRTRDGRCRHDKDMRMDSRKALCPQTGPLLHAEAVLLVNHGKAQRMELHRIFNERMRADEHSHGAVLQPGMDFPPGLGARVACEQFNSYAGWGQVAGYVGIVLLGKHFRRCHDAGLVAVSHGDERTQDRHHGLAAAHVSLKEAVHLVPAHHVLANLLDNAFLGTCKVIRQ